MLPVSGAEQLNTSGANGERPMISQSGAYSRLVSPAPSFALRQEQVPQPGGARLRLQLLDDRPRLPAHVGADAVIVFALVRIDVLVHEMAELFLKVLDLGGMGEIHLPRSPDFAAMVRSVSLRVEGN